MSIFQQEKNHKASNKTGNYIQHAADQNKLIETISEETKTWRLLEKDFDLIILNVLKDLKQRMVKELKQETDAATPLKYH